MRAKSNPQFRTDVTLGALFVGVFILMSLLSPSNFLRPLNIESMAFQLPEFAIFALAQMIVIMTGGINISITLTAALSSIVSTILMVAMNSAHASPALSIAVGIVVMISLAVLCGAFNGAVVAFVGVSPILVTLGSMTLFDGICLQITRGQSVSGLPASFLWVGNGTLFSIPVPMVILIIVLIFTYYIVHRTSFGLKLYMTGSNPTATVFSGINVKRLLFILYVYSGFLCGLAALIMTSRYNSAKSTNGSSYLLQSIAATVLGGTAIIGGSGSVFGVVLATMILQVISTGLDIFGFNRFFTNVVMGAILIIVLALNNVSAVKLFSQRFGRSRQ